MDILFLNLLGIDGLPRSRVSSVGGHVAASSSMQWVMESPCDVLCRFTWEHASKLSGVYTVSFYIVCAEALLMLGGP